MSGVSWSGNRLIQRVRGQKEELGYIELDPNSATCVLWLKDTFGVASTAGTYIRADEYPSMAVAREEALNAPSVFIWHLIWMRGAVKREAEKEIEDHWEELSAGVENALEKEGLKDRIRAHLDRLPSEEIKKLFKEIGAAAFREIIVEAIKRFIFGG